MINNKGINILIFQLTLDKFIIPAEDTQKTLLLSPSIIMVQILLLSLVGDHNTLGNQSI